MSWLKFEDPLSKFPKKKSILEMQMLCTREKGIWKCYTSCNGKKNWEYNSKSIKKGTGADSS